MNANSAVVEAILALPAKLDPRRAGSGVKSRPRPAVLARDIDRPAAATNGGASRKRPVKRMPAAAQASLPASLAAYAAVRQRRCDRI